MAPDPPDQPTSELARVGGANANQASHRHKSQRWEWRRAVGHESAYRQLQLVAVMSRPSLTNELPVPNKSLPFRRYLPRGYRDDIEPLLAGAATDRNRSAT